MRKGLRRIGIVSSTLLMSVSLASCAIGTEDVSPVVSNDTETDTTTTATPTYSYELPDHANPESDEISNKVADFLVFSATPLDNIEEPPSDDSRLNFYEQQYDLNQYMNYYELSPEEKLNLHDIIANYKKDINKDGAKALSFKVQPGGIIVEGDTATIPGPAISIINPEEGNANYDGETEIIAIRINNGWTIDARSIIDNFPPGLILKERIILD